MATFRILGLLPIKSSTFCYTDCLPTSSYTGVVYFKKWSVCLAHPVYLVLFLGYRGSWGLFPFSPCDVMWCKSVVRMWQLRYLVGIYKPCTSVALTTLKPRKAYYQPTSAAWIPFTHFWMISRMIPDIHFGIPWQSKWLCFVQNLNEWMKMQWF